MKKYISLILAIVMITACFTGVFTASAEESSKIDEIISDMTNMDNFQASVSNGATGFEYEEGYQDDINAMIENNEISGEMFGISVDFLYNSTETLIWNNISVEKNDLALAIGNVNNYLKRIMDNKYGGFNLFSMEKNSDGIPYANYYATVITNFLGNLFYPDFQDVTIEFEGSETVSEDEFYTQIVRHSGLGYLIDTNWCDQGRFDFRPLMKTWGLYSDEILDSEYSNGYILGRKLVAAAIDKFLSEGPLNAMLDIIQIYSRAYKPYLYDATVALFNLKIAANEIELEELDSLHELFNIVFNGNDPDAEDKLQFIQMPTERFAIAEGTTELFLYILLYSNINANYKNNNAVIEDYKSKIDETDLSDSEKSNIKSILDAILKGEVNDMVNNLTDLFNYNLEQVPNDFLKKLTDALASFFNKIAEYFDNLFKVLSGEKEPPRWDIEDR